MPRTLTPGEKHLLSLVRQGTEQDADSEGWARVSIPVLSLVMQLPSELVEVRDDPPAARLTAEGNSVLNAMAWL